MPYDDTGELWITQQELGCPNSEHEGSRIEPLRWRCGRPELQREVSFSLRDVGLKDQGFQLSPVLSAGYEEGRLVALSTGS